jgi:glutamyl-tRNA reductase
MSAENCDYRSENEKEAKKPQKPSKNLLTGGQKSSILTKLVARAASKLLGRPVRTLKTIQNNNNANKTVIPNE